MHCIAGVLCQEMTPRFISRVLHMHCVAARWLHLPLPHKTFLKRIILPVHSSTVTKATLQHAILKQSGILLLPDPCLLAVLRCCAGDPGSVCSAARAHSKLHQAAVEALSSIDALLNQDELDNLVDVYLSKHGQHMESISLEGVGYSGILHQLAPNLTKLSSLGLISLDLRLQPGSGYPSVLGAAAAPTLKQLRLDGCRLAVSSLTGRNNGLAAALALLPELEHLALADMTEVFIPGDVWLKMSRLTYLELEGAHMQGPGPGDNIDLQHLSVVTQLVDLRLSGLYDHNIISVGKLPGLQHLTRLQLTHNGDIDFEPAALAGKTLLQHLVLQGLKLPDDTTGETQLLSQLQDLQQLTCLMLDVFGSGVGSVPYPPAAAYSALTASSKLQHLDVAWCCLPTAVWQHILPTSRQLPLLQVLNVSHVKDPEYVPAAAPEGTRLVSCCPGLQSLQMQGLKHIVVGLAGLQGLSGLHTLHLERADGSTDQLSGVLQLTGLQDLQVRVATDEQVGLFLQLTQLQQLTRLQWDNARHNTLQFTARDDEPVWRQILRQVCSPRL